MKRITQVAFLSLFLTGCNDVETEAPKITFDRDALTQALDAQIKDKGWKFARSSNNSGSENSRASLQISKQGQSVYFLFRTDDTLSEAYDLRIYFDSETPVTAELFEDLEEAMPWLKQQVEYEDILEVLRAASEPQD